MSRKSHYIFDNDLLEFVKKVPDKGKRRKKKSVFFLISFILAFLSLTFLPEEAFNVEVLMSENERKTLIYHLDSLSHRLETINQKLDSLYTTDSVYFSMLEMEMLPEAIMEGGFGGSDASISLPSNHSKKLGRISKHTKMLEARIRIKEHATSVIEQTLKEFKQKLEHTPYIHPIAPKDIKQWGSGFVSSRLHPILHYFREHEGIDLIANEDVPVYAPATGVATKVRRSISFGNYVTISHGYGIKTLYAHLHRFNIAEGDSVKLGDIIGYVGSTGLSSGDHLHYEIHVDDEPVDPMNFIHDKLTQKEFEKIVRGDLAHE